MGRRTSLGNVDQNDCLKDHITEVLDLGFQDLDEMSHSEMRTAIVRGRVFEEVNALAIQSLEADIDLLQGDESQSEEKIEKLEEELQNSRIHVQQIEEERDIFKRKSSQAESLCELAVKDSKTNQNSAEWAEFQLKEISEALVISAKVNARCRRMVKDLKVDPDGEIYDRLFPDEVPQERAPQEAEGCPAEEGKDHSNGN